MHFLWVSHILLLVAVLPSALLENDTSSHGKGHDTKPAEDDLKILVGKFLHKAIQVVANNDPYQVGKTVMNYNSYGIVSKGNLSNTILSFMSTMNLTNLIVESKESFLLFGFDLSFKQLQIIGDSYWYFDALTMLKLSLSGPFGILLKGLQVKLKTSIKETENHILQLADLDLKARLDESKVELDELNEKKALGGYVSNILTDILAVSINENPQVFAGINIVLKGLLNSIMVTNSVTMEKVVDVMVHFIQ